MDRLIKINGIYRFCIDNKDSICQELLNRIPKGSIVNYSDRDVFDIVNSHSISPNVPIEGSQLAVQTYVPGLNSAQRHTYVNKDDSIIFVNSSWIVRNIILDLYTQHKRQEAINSIIS